LVKKSASLPVVGQWMMVISLRCVALRVIGDKEILDVNVSGLLPTPPFTFVVVVVDDARSWLEGWICARVPRAVVRRESWSAVT
jgi:hypothetical protein